MGRGVVGHDAAADERMALPVMGRGGSGARRDSGQAHDEGRGTDNERLLRGLWISTKELGTDEHISTRERGILFFVWGSPLGSRT